MNAKSSSPRFLFGDRVRNNLKPAPVAAIATNPATPVVEPAAAPTPPPAPKPEAPFNLEAELAKLDEPERKALERAVGVINVPIEWIVRTRLGFIKPREVVHTIVLHENPDTEALFITWLLTSNSSIRERFNVKEGASLNFVPSGELKPNEQPWKEFCSAQVNAKYLEEHGFLFVDCGGGGARLDQHGREENTLGTKVSSLDILVAYYYEAFHEFGHLVQLLSLISRNDKTGEMIAKQTSASRKTSKTPHTARHIRNILDGLNERVKEDRTFSWNRVADLIFIAFEGAENFCASLCTGEESDWAEIEEKKYQIFLFETFAEHLPKPVTDREAKERGHKRGSLEADQLGHKRGRRVIGEERKAIIDRCVENDRVAALRRRTLLESLNEVFEGALAKLESDWVEATRDYHRFNRLEVLEDLAFVRRDDSREDEAQRVPTRGRVYVVLAVSNSNRFGAYTRYLLNGIEKQRVKTDLIVIARQRYGVNLLPPAVEDKPKLLTAGQTEEVMSAKDGPASSVTKAETAETVVLETVGPATAVDAGPELAAEFEPDEGNGVEDEPETGPDDEIVKGGDYAGLPKKVKRAIAAAVDATKAKVVTIQIRNPVVKGDRIANCKFGIATTHIYLNDVVEAIRGAMAEASGMEIVDNDLANAPYLTMRDRKGNEYRLDYRPEWGTYYGDWFKTNQTLPFSRLPARVIQELVIKALCAASDKLLAQAKRGEITLELPEWFVRLDEMLDLASESAN